MESCRFSAESAKRTVSSAKRSVGIGKSKEGRESGRSEIKRENRRGLRGSP
jgi:hypothetical protein